MAYCEYLRKSRVDEEAEAHGEGETLARHEKELALLAKSKKITISKIYREIVSGESISARPIMQQLLQDVENGLWEGVLVVEVERLARGNTLDQGLVSNAFKYTNTKIITPNKTYDPADEFDEEYFEFGLFMSRREYKVINRRLMGGRIASVKEGKFVSSEPPFGYEKYKLPNQKGFSLRIKDNEAEIVKLIYKLYSEGVGIRTICSRLDAMGIKPKNSTKWGKTTITNILKNIVYTGKIRYTNKETIKKVIDGQLTRVKNDNPDIIIVDGIHEAIIDDKLYDKVQNIFKNNIISRKKLDYTLKNPFAGILFCQKCGWTIRRQQIHKSQERLYCTNCDNISSSFSDVENKLMDALKVLLEQYKLKYKAIMDNNDATLQKINDDTIDKLKNELVEVNKQLDKTYDLLEKGIYSEEIFLNRHKTLKDKCIGIENEILALSNTNKSINDTRTNIENYIPKIEEVINTYNTADTAELKNKLLKSVLNKITYLKTKKYQAFELTLYPKIHI